MKELAPPPDAPLTIVAMKEGTETDSGEPEYLVEWFVLGVRGEAWVRESQLEEVDSS